MEKCPKGYTACRDVLGDRHISCITIEACNIKRKEKGKKGGESKDDKEEDLFAKEKAREESLRESQQEQVEQILEFFSKLKQGLLIDPETGEVEETIDLSNPDNILKFLKKLKGMYTREVLAQVPGIPNLDEFLTILNSPTVTARAEIGRGIMEKFLTQLGIELPTEEKDA